MYEDRDAILRVLYRYADACDRRNFDLFADVFTADWSGDFVGQQIADHSEFLEMVRSNLGGCGPTQHLIGNAAVTVDGDTATATCRVRAVHLDAGERSEVPLEIFGQYDDRLVRTVNGWRIQYRVMTVDFTTGPMDVLKPADENPQGGV
jgi:hypothetical protein